MEAYQVSRNEQVDDRPSVWSRKRTRIVALTAIIAGTLALVLGSSAAAQAVPLPVTPTTVTATTHITSRPDSGNGGVWAYDSVARVLTVTVAASQTGAPTGDTLYTATVMDSGGFSAVQGAGTPSQFVPGSKVQHHVVGTLAGGLSYTVTAPTADTLTGVIPASEDDNFATPLNSTSNWPKLAFATPTGVTVTENNDWSWTYKTSCETWVDSAANGDGNLSNDGNITGALCSSNVPYVYAGHVVTVSRNSAVVGWSESAGGWPSSNHCVEVYMYGFDRPAGTAHVGFTCDNGDRTQDIGYMSGLSVGHSVSLFVRPAVGTYGNHHPIPGTDARAHIYVVTPAA
jgi:hypothetical protein